MYDLNDLIWLTYSSLLFYIGPGIAAGLILLFKEYYRVKVVRLHAPKKVYPSSTRRRPAHA